MVRALHLLVLAGLLPLVNVWAQNSPAGAPLPAPSLVATVTANPAFQEKRATPQLVQALRKGGYVLYMRHATTDANRPDRTPKVDLGDCTSQRPLTQEGRRLASRIGKAVRDAHIPIGEVWTSPMCRTRETARLAFGNRVQEDMALMYTSNMTAAQKQPVLENTRRRLSTPVALGSNRVIVSHAPNLADLFGYFIAPEGTVAIFAPRGNGNFDYLASIHPDDWPALRH